jgi:hypothetical protein
MAQLCLQKNTSVCGNLNFSPFMSGASSHQNSLLNSGHPRLLKHKHSAKLSKSPALSFAESFATALTSQPDGEDNMSCPPPSSLFPPQPLRKSVSVDSFALYRCSPREPDATPHHSSENPLHGHSFVPEARLGGHLLFIRKDEFETSNTLKTTFQILMSTAMTRQVLL